MNEGQLIAVVSSIFCRRRFSRAQKRLFVEFLEWERDKTPENCLWGRNRRTLLELQIDGIKAELRKLAPLHKAIAGVDIA
jgi:hypothetical protein